MEIPNQSQIREACRQAADIAKNSGTREALSVLIGEAFYRIFRNLKDCQNKIKFLALGAPGQPQKPTELEAAGFELELSPQVEKNYKQRVHQIQALEKTLPLFISEIKKYFASEDITAYLNGYPRFGSVVSSQLGRLGQPEGSDGETGDGDILGEARDILTAEEIKKLFSSS